jgi:polyisoprenoid-binding protein YceI
MKKSLFIAASVALLFAFKPIEQTTWTSDAGHSRLAFSITHMGVNDIEGNFNSFDASITSSKDDFSDAVIEMSADVNTINTGNEKRDAHLKSPDFFDAAKFGKLTFKSKSVKVGADKKYTVVGDLTMHGVTKEVILTGMRRMGTNPMSKKDVAGFKVSGTIKRMDFNVGAAMPAAMLSDEVQLDANLEFGKK